MKILQREKPQFDMLKKFQGVKSDLKRLTGSHATYYDILGYFGYEKSDQIPTLEKALKILAELRAVYEEQLRLVTNR